MEVKSLISGSEFFGGISPTSVDSLSRIAVPKRVQKNELFFTEGQKGRSFFLLASGSVQLSKTSAEGKEVVIKVLKPGEIFGEVVLFETDSYPVSARAIKRSLAYVMSRYQTSCLLENEGFRNDFIRLLMRKQRYLTDKILSLSACDVEERFFRFLAEQYGKREEYSVELSKKEFASAIGALPETLSRLLFRLGRKGVLAWKGGRIVLERGFWEKNGELYV